MKEGGRAEEKIWFIGGVHSLGFSLYKGRVAGRCDDGRMEKGKGKEGGKEGCVLYDQVI